MRLEWGAIHTAEALLLARYFMYTQVYFHDVRRVYDLHLKDFLQSMLPNGKFSAKLARLDGNHGPRGAFGNA